jgi:short-subunit dehydrogenase
MPFNVHVLTILPGFVDTPMTAEIPKNFLFAKADDVGAAIVNAIEKKKNVLYTPFFWLYIMTIVKIIPEFIYKRLKT